jgi:protein-tyrosine phosphatase
VIFFSKNKNILKDLIPENYIDIHSHLLPGIDDGAQTIEDTIFLVTELKKIGFSKLITTPHTFTGVWDNTKDQIKTLESKTIADLKQNNIDITIQAASEYLLDDHFASLFKKGEILTLKDNYVLVEMSYLNPPIHLYDIIFDLQVAGYKPVLAHPERYTFYHKNFNEFSKLKNAGCLFQINLLSSVGYYGETVAETAKHLLSKGLIDFAGSDLHHKRHLESFDKKIIFKDIQPLKEAIANNQFFK